MVLPEDNQRVANSVGLVVNNGVAVLTVEMLSYLMNATRADALRGLEQAMIAAALQEEARDGS